MSDRDHLNASLRMIAKGAGIGFVGTAIGMGFGFLTRIVIARFLGPDEYGLISLGFAALNIAVIIGLLGLRTG
jgi:O-antigen/teichoic acid export membrane protein